MPFLTLRGLPLAPKTVVQEPHVDKLRVGESHIDVDVADRRQEPHVGLSLSSHTRTPSAGDAPLRDDPDTPEALSAAIELKFLVPVLKPGAVDNGFPDDHRPIIMAVEAQKDGFQDAVLQVHGSVAWTISQHAGTTVRQRSVTLHDIKAAQHLERDYWDSHWIVKKANSALPTADEDNKGSNYIWIPVEVCSPKQKWNDEDGLGTALQTVTAVLRALTQHHRVSVNYTCDVHVHVGRTDGTHLSLDTLKRLATMLWFSEDTIRSVRDPNSPNYQNVFTWGAELTRHSRLARLVEPMFAHDQFTRRHHTLSDAKFLKALRQQTPAIHAIWSADSHLKLGRLLSGSTAQYRRLGFNFSCLGEEDARAKNGPKTVEFRVLEGTLDEDVISAWFAICWKLVEVAGAGEHDGRFIEVLRTCFADVDTDSYQQYALRRGRGPDGPAACAELEEGFIMRRRFRTLAVDGLGISADMCDAFVVALFQGRSM